MKFRFLMIAMLATAVFCAAPTWAGRNGPAPAQNGSANQQGATPDSTTKPSNYSITLTMIEAPTTCAAGYCTGGEGFESFCPSGSCSCCTYTGTASGSAGKGAMTFYETYDYGAGSTSYGIACSPAYGEIDIAGSKDTEAIAFTGGDCFPDTAPYYAPNLLNGGCMLWDSNVYTTGGAIAACGGTYSSSNNTKFRIKGKALK
ncbi:hypothetical protein [Candidatus Binatus sp.]|uniref:hypothetical protein n=1 Tax=Candidatus Binatus sp. TaxID=2811406 RepID=UPI002F953311